MSVAKLVVDKLDVSLGEKVGYNILFEANTGPKTILKYLMDGILLRDVINDPDLY